MRQLQKISRRNLEKNVTLYCKQSVNNDKFVFTIGQNQRIQIYHAIYKGGRGRQSH